VPDLSRSWVDELRLGGVLADTFRRIGLDESEAWRATDLARLLVRLPTPATAEAPAATVAETGSTLPSPMPAMPAMPDARPAAETGSTLPGRTRAARCVAADDTCNASSG
jgi:hypothetical protein